MATMHKTTEHRSYGVESGRRTPEYERYYQRCADEHRPFIMVSEYMHGGILRAKLTIDAVTVPEMISDATMRRFGYLVDEHRQPGTRVHIHGIRSDIYNLRPSEAHYLAATLARWIGVAT